jgi:hypothetical protein
MRITASQLRRLIREALAAEDRQFIQGIIDDLQALEQATAEVEGLSDDAPADERKKKLEALTTAVRGILSYEGEDLAIGESPEELEMLTAAGFDPTSIKQLLGYAVSVHTKAEEAQRQQPANSTRSPTGSSSRVPAGSVKMPDKVRVSGRYGPVGATTQMSVHLEGRGGYELDVPNSWDGATVGSNAPALRIGDSTYRWVRGGFLGIRMAMIGTNGTHWYLLDDTGLYRLPSLSEAKDLAGRIKG